MLTFKSWAEWDMSCSGIIPTVQVLNYLNRVDGDECRTLDDF